MTSKLKTMTFFVSLLLLLSLVSGINRGKTMSEDNPVAVIRTSKGKIRVELFEDDAPKTVDNFIKYANDGFYDGLIFHRVIEDFMIQGGGFEPDMNKKEPTYSPIENEAKKSGHSNERGTIAMARTSDPDSATSQFFINTVDNPNLDPGGASEAGYCVFGEVISGMDVVDQIEKVKTHTENGHENVPVNDILINSAEIQSDSGGSSGGSSSGSASNSASSSGGIGSFVMNNMLMIEIVGSIIAALAIVLYLSKNKEEG